MAGWTPAVFMGSIVLPAQSREGETAHTKTDRAADFYFHSLSAVSIKTSSTGSQRVTSTLNVILYVGISDVSVRMAVCVCVWGRKIVPPRAISLQQAAVLNEETESRVCPC